MKFALFRKKFRNKPAILAGALLATIVAMLSFAQSSGAALAQGQSPSDNKPTTKPRKAALRRSKLPS
jgi:hypothetical protein